MAAVTALLLAATLSPGTSHARAERVVLSSDASGSRLARESLDLCLGSKLDRGLELAEKAVAETPNDAKAHFAVFCNLGRQLETRGADLASVSDVGRLKEEIDRALEIEPAFIDALIAKGRFLDQLPWIMGGDDDESEQLLRKAVSLAPDYAQARVFLAEFLLEHDETEEARRLAIEASILAKASGERELLARARTVADEARG
ncbi:MAG: hypothetical protein FJ144_21655 [Deltaproteobacteria bacterium]|nr:hypothetical protein [Deltaproteobacteria bacterium]